VAILDTITSRLLSLLEPVLKPVRSIVGLLVGFKDKTVNLLDDFTNLINSAVAEYEKIKNFKSRPQWKNRVVSVPRVLQNVTVLAAVPAELLNAIKDLIANVKSRFTGGSSDLTDEDLAGIEDVRGLLTRLGPKLARVGEKLLGVVTIVVDTISTLSNTIADLQTIVDDVTKVREDLENLDGIFLPQNNKRRVLTTTSGETFNIRVGSLHQL